MLHKLFHGHKKKPAIVGYDGISNIWGCAICEGKELAQLSEATHIEEKS